MKIKITYQNFIDLNKNFNRMLKHCLIHDDKIFSISEDDFLVKSDKLLVLYVNNIKKN